MTHETAESSHKHKGQQKQGGGEEAAGGSDQSLDAMPKSMNFIFF